MDDKGSKMLATIVLMGMLGGLVFWGFWSTHALERDHVLGVAHVNGCSYSGRGNTVYVNYSMSVNGKSFADASSYSNGRLRLSDCERHFVGKSFPVVYVPGDPTISMILIAPKDFSRFGYAFPDSLNWVVPYFKK